MSFSGIRAKASLHCHCSCFPTHFTLLALMPPLPLFPRSFMRFTSSTSREVRVIPSTGKKPWSCDPTHTRLLRRVIPSTEQKPWSCDPTDTRLLRRIACSAACSSPTDAFTLRGKTRGVGTFHCSKTRKILGQSPRHPTRPSSLKRHG